jgi:serine/threonine protein phosphatase PrpC
MGWSCATATDIGGRPAQQDRVAVLRGARRDERLLVLADGMGGQQGGGEAAQAVVETARREFGSTRIREPREFLVRLCLRAHQAIRALGRHLPGDPGSTCSLLYLRPREAYWVHVGDTRLYHFRGPELRFRTADHSLGELAAGCQADSRGGPPAADRGDTRLYMCLGGNNPLDPAFGACAVTPADWFALCSDGLWSHVSAQEMAHVVTGSGSTAGAATELLGLARGRAGDEADNLSLALARPGAGGDRWLRARRWLGAARR